MTGHKEKTALIQSSLASFEDLWLLFTFLLPKQEKRVYSVQDKRMVTYLADMLGIEESKVQAHSDACGDISLTAEHYHSASDAGKSVAELTMGDPAGLSVAPKNCETNAHKKDKIRASSPAKTRGQPTSPW